MMVRVLIDLSPRAIRGLAGVLGAVAALVSTATAGPARAEEKPVDWVTVFSDDEGEIQVDRVSMARHGGVVYSWMTYTPRKRHKSPVNNQKYDYQLHARIDDCTAATMATEVILYTRYDGRDVEVNRAEGPLKFGPHPPGSVGELVASTICRLGAQATALQSSVSLDKVEPGDWRSLGPDQGRGATLSVLTPSAYRDGSTAAIVVRGDFAKPLELEDGRGYSRIVEQAIFVCDEKTYVVLSSDYYNSSGLLVAADRHPLETAPVRPVGDSGVAEVAKAACSAPGATHTGTGWLAGQGYIVTASHVVGELTEVEVFQEGRRLGAAQVVRNDPANDVAVLKPLFDTSRHAALRVSASAPALGARVLTLGYPLADELGVGAVKMTTGDVSSLAGVDVATGRADDHRYLQVSIPVQSGNSGGPVIAADGSVVGLIVGKQEMSADREIVQNVNFALKAAYINGVIEGLPAIGRAKVSSARGDTAAVVAGAQSGVFLIVAAPKREQTAAR
ncbi:serine protease [Caulobacter sp. 17J80-11]|uniref:S1 family peptidase n=1 Tax=Caulobacter sp. 17J80-11 TaxID=2763502 RepID=UPI0016538686|nr:serine protease [Caulobacter sp. 17J80-11]MBC6981943.1 trypsin-like peptidase domain-containing protein [Caulobacter sp. 17J80-11]